jgi:hypothetical protein
LFFLLIQYFAAAIGPSGGLLSRLPGAIADKLTAVLGSGANRLPGFIAGAWSEKHASGRANA